MPEYQEIRPYPGLRRFEQYEAQIFFGRETHTDRLLEILQREHFLAVIGPSGSGKSSLVTAGMLPAIAAGWLGTVGRWRLVLLRPGDHPIRNLARALLAPGALAAELAVTGEDDHDAEDRLLPLVQAELRRGPLALRHLLERAHRRNGAALNVLVLVDQFEELFRFTDQGADQADEADAFVDLLLVARAAAPAAVGADDSRPQIFVALTMRTDFLGHCVRFADLPDAINRAQYLTPRLNRAQLEMAIAAPARVCGGDVQPEVVNELINVVSADSDQLPILQHALARMWEEASRRAPDSPEITRSELEQVGGIEGALDRHAERVFGELSADQQALAEHLFRTITGRSLPESGSRDTRRPQTVQQIAFAAGLGERWRDFVPVVEAFAREGVNFLACTQPLEADTRIDIMHEALIRQWHRLQHWVVEEADRAAEYRRWRNRVGEEPLTGADLARALEWEAGTAAWHPTAAWAARYATGDDPTAEFERTVAYVARSRQVDEERREAEERRRHQELEREAAQLRAEKALAEERAARERARIRQVCIGAIAVVLVVLGFAGEMYLQKQKAERALAERQFREAVNRVQREDRSEALGYLADAMRHDPDYPVARLLTASLLLDRTWPLPLVPPMHHDDQVFSVAISPDGTRLLTASADRTAQLWDLHSGAKLGTMQHGGWVRTASFSRDGGRIVTVSDDGTAALWDGHSGAPWPGAQKMVHTLVHSAAFSPDGTRIVTASWDGTAHLWDAKTGAPWPGAQTMHHDGAIYSAVFSPDETQILTASRDKTAKLWDATTGAPLLTAPMTHDDAINSAVFSSDGTRIVTASWDGTARLWNAHTGQPWDTARNMDHKKAVVNSAVFSPNGRRIVTSSSDGTARLWDASTGAPDEEASFMRHGSAVNSAIFSPDGQQIATASDDGTARLWDAADGHPLTERMPHGDAVAAVAFSPEGSQVATASHDKTARLWDVRPGAAAAEPRRIDGVESAAFSPDPTDSRILTVSLKDGVDRVQLWRGNEAKLVTKATGARDVVLSAAFNRLADRILVVSTSSVSLWDPGRSTTLVPELKHDGDAIGFAAFSPDGSQVIGTSRDAVWLWNAASRDLVKEIPVNEAAAPPRQPETETDCTVCADITRDGARVVAVAGNIARLWDVPSGERLAHSEPMVHRDAIRSVAFDPEGRRVVTASNDGTAQIWDAFSGKPWRDSKPLQHAQAVYAAVFSPDGLRVMTGSKDNTARLWDANTGDPLGEPMRHRGPVTSVSFSPDKLGVQVLTASDDGTVRVWDGTSGVPLTEPIPHASYLYSAVFSPDGARILTAAADDKIRIYTLPRTTAADQPDLARMAEIVGGVTIDSASGALSRRTEPTLGETQFASRPAAGSPTFSALKQWFFADRGTRAMSPFATMTHDEDRPSAGE